jgi:hypothetical protein
LKRSNLLQHLNGKVFLTQFNAYEELNCVNWVVYKTILDFYVTEDLTNNTILNAVTNINTQIDLAHNDVLVISRHKIQ